MTKLYWALTSPFLEIWGRFKYKIYSNYDEKLKFHILGNIWSTPVDQMCIYSFLMENVRKMAFLHYKHEIWSTGVDQMLTKIIFFQKYVSGAFKCRVDDNFSMSGYENSTWWSYNIFGHFRCIFGIFHQITKMTKNVRKCCNFIRLNILDQKSKNYHRHVIWKPWLHTFQKNDFGQHLVNRCWLNFHPKSLYIVLGCYQYGFPNTVGQHLLTRCWLNSIFWKVYVQGFQMSCRW